MNIATLLAARCSPPAMHRALVHALQGACAWASAPAPAALLPARGLCASACACAAGTSRPDSGSEASTSGPGAQGVQAPPHRLTKRRYLRQLRAAGDDAVVRGHEEAASFHGGIGQYAGALRLLRRHNYGLPALKGQASAAAACAGPHARTMRAAQPPCVQPLEAGRQARGCPPLPPTCAPMRAPMSQVVLARILRVTDQLVHVDPGFHSITDVPRAHLDLSHVHRPAPGQVRGRRGSTLLAQHAACACACPQRPARPLHCARTRVQLDTPAALHARRRSRPARRPRTCAWAMSCRCAWTRCTRRTGTCRRVWRGRTRAWRRPRSASERARGEGQQVAEGGGGHVARLRCNARHGPLLQAAARSARLLACLPACLSRSSALPPAAPGGGNDDGAGGHARVVSNMAWRW